MWPRRSDALFIGLSRVQVGWQIAGHAARSIALPGPAAQFAHVAAALGAEAAECKIASVHVVVGSGVARHWLQTVPSGLRSLSELKAMVHSRADQLFGSEAGWVVAADWHASRPFMCAALPIEIDSLTAELALSKRATASVATSLSLALAQYARYLPTDGWAILQEAEFLHMLYLSARAPEYFRTVMAPVGLEAPSLERQVTAEVGRASALAGGLPTSPLTILPICQDPGADESSSSLALAVKSHSGMAS